MTKYGYDVTKSSAHTGHSVGCQCALYRVLAAAEHVTGVHNIQGGVEKVGILIAAITFSSANRF